jgi:ArsR family transcriptional regulator
MSRINTPISRLDQAAAFLKAAADPLRLLILRVLASNSYNVAELCQIFSLRQPALSHHLKLLAHAGLILSRKEGTSAFYRRVPISGELTALAGALYQTTDRLELDESIQSNVADVHQARTATAEQFFEVNASSLREQQDLIADFGVYGEQVAEMIDRLSKQHNTALEVGPGRGELLSFLSQRYQNVQAVDISSSMLDVARQTVKQGDLDNVTLIHGDTGDGDIKDADLIVVNMVLHHTPSPARIFKDLAGHLSQQGILVVCDLVRHDQSWVKDACGDLWQGFVQEELLGWAHDASLKPVDSQFFALRNGFQFQLFTFTTQVGNTDE